MDEKEVNVESVESGRKRQACYDTSPSNPKKIHLSPLWESFTALPGGRKAKCHYCGKEIVCSRIFCLKSHNDRCKSYKKYQEIEKNKVVTFEGMTSDDKHKLGIVVGFSKIKCREAIVKMVILNELPFSFVENQGFRYFCRQVIPIYKVPTRKLIAKEVLKLFLKEKVAVKNMLSGQRVSFTTDIWTAITKVSYMVITAHFIDENWKLQRKIISFKPISDHKGNSIAMQFEKCVDDWDIKKVFTITVDNASANDHALNLLNTKWKKTLGDDGLILDGEFLHVRCAAHILNIIVEEGLKRVSGNITSIRNAVKYIRSSSSRFKAFQRIAGEKQINRGNLVLDCCTRWNSTFFMLRSALKFKTVFNRMAEEDKLYAAYFHEDDPSSGEEKVGPPSSKDWDIAHVMVKFLKVFYESTLAFSASKKVTSNICYSEICNVEKVLRTFSESPDSNIALKNVAHSMKYEKFDKYWEAHKNINKLLIIASVLDPRLKMRFLMHCFEEMYGEGSQSNKKCAEMEEMVMSLLRKLYNVYSSSCKNSIDLVNDNFNQDEDIQIIDARSQGLDEECDLSDVGVPVGVKENIFEECNQISRDREIGDDSLNELDNYLMENIVKPKTNILGYKYDLLDWWKVNNKIYPVLARMAKDIFAIPVSTVSSESAFSTGNRILDETRSRLNSSSVESLILTQNWLQSSSSFDV